MPSHVFYSMVLVVLAWLMLRVGVGAAIVGGFMFFDGNRWALVLIVPAAVGTRLAVLAAQYALQGYGRGPSARE